MYILIHTLVGTGASIMVCNICVAVITGYKMNSANSSHEGLWDKYLLEVVGSLNQVLLDGRDTLERELHSQVSSGHHDTICGLQNRLFLC